MTNVESSGAASSKRNISNFSEYRKPQRASNSFQHKSSRQPNNPAAPNAPAHLNNIVTSAYGHDILFEDLTAKPTCENVFNLSDLEDGDYVVLVSSGKEKITRTLHIRTETKVDKQLTVE